MDTSRPSSCSAVLPPKRFFSLSMAWRVAGLMTVPVSTTMRLPAFESSSSLPMMALSASSQLWGMKPPSWRITGPLTRSLS